MHSIYTSIPAELRALDQWVIAGADKLPRSPRSGRSAAVDNPETWGGFVEACAAEAAFIGFVLTAADPYCIIDLDKPDNEQQAARHRRIMEHTRGTYREFSQSGDGVHIVIRGKVPAGCRRDRVEVYSDSRYMIFTGGSIDPNPAPILDMQHIADILYREMGTAVPAHQPSDTDAPASGDDQAIWQRASAAANGDKFRRLWNGAWSELGYPSQSEADYALLSMLDFHSRNREQVRRMFRASALGRRDKAQSDIYLDRAIDRQRAKRPPPVDISTLVASAAPEEAMEEAAPAMPPPPPGMLRTIADYITHTAVHPMPAAGLAGALALVGGIAGRAFNVKGLGLNQYLLLLAETGTGKTSGLRGMDRILNVVRQTIPAVDTLRGPSSIASGIALHRQLAEHPTQLSVIGECGHFLVDLTDPNASQSQRDTNRMLLDLYSASGEGSVYGARVYADSTKNITSLMSPAFTILGDTTPAKLTGKLTGDHIADGFLPRFTFIQHTGGRAPRNEGRWAGSAPTEDITEFVTALATMALEMNGPVNGRGVTRVTILPEAVMVFRDFDVEVQHITDSSHDENVKQMWSRAYEKAHKLAAVHAVTDAVADSLVSRGPLSPVIGVEGARWATAFTRWEIGGFLGATGGDDAEDGGAGILLGEEERRQVALLQFFRDWSKLSARSRRMQSKVTRQLPERLVAYNYLSKRACKKAVYRQHRMGAVFALKSELREAEQRGVIGRVPEDQSLKEFGTRTPLYYLV